MITFRIRVCLLGWLVLLVLCAAPAGATKYVDCTVASEGGGTSWGDAFKTISNAVAKVTNGEEIWVAKGQYTNWALATGMAVGNHTLLGGYPTGGGTRDWVANPTILDGLSAKRVFNKTGAGVFTLDGFTVQNGLDAAGGGGGALVCTAGSLTIRNCFFTNNVITTATGGGGAIRTDVAAVENIFSNCTFTANTAPGSGAYGGAFFARYSSTNSFVSCTFVTNRATSSGGAVSAYEAAGFTQVRDCVFSNNVSSGNGGAINSPSPLVVSGGTNVFCGNVASSSGGAILGRTVSVYNSLFTNNVSGGSGAIRTDSGSDCLISNCTFTANEGGGHGAAVYMAGANTYTFDACTFETNRASGAGGGAISLNLAGGLLKVKNCTFANNVCSGGSGGAIHSLSPLDIFGSINVIRGNVASSAGGAINSTAALTIQNCSFSNNTSASHGGAINATVAGAENLFSNCTFTANATSGGWGGALYMNGASANTFDACAFVTNRSGGSGNGGAVCLYSVGGLLKVKNCAFTNNVSPGANGGAIYSSAPLDISGSNNVFYGNVASANDGGAIYGSAANAANVFSNCTFTANAVGGANLGGAVYLSGASSTNTLMNCAFVANTATGASGRAGGVYFVGNSADNQVMNCTFFTNTSASQGGAVYLGGTTPTLGITNSIFWMDVSASGGEVYRSAGTIAIAYTSIDTNKIFASPAPTYGSGITNVNPLFASETVPYDVHLKSTAGRWLNGGWVVDGVKSPCIDAGDTNSPYALEPEGNGGRINLGAYGNTLVASLSSPRGSGTVFKLR